MPIHDWTRVDAGLFHHFRQRWIIAICDALNSGGLPEGYYALAEQVANGPIPDVLTVQSQDAAGGLALATAPLKTRFTMRSHENAYARRADCIAIRHPLGHVVAMTEIVSPGNKSSVRTLRAFVEKAAEWIQSGIHVLIVDLFPPGNRDPQGIHKAIWDEIQDEHFELPSDKPLTLAAYSAGETPVAYVEPVAVGDPLVDMPLFLSPERYVLAPLESAYQTAWKSCPRPLQRLLEGTDNAA